MEAGRDGDTRDPGAGVLCGCDILIRLLNAHGHGFPFDEKMVHNNINNNVRIFFAL